MLFLYFDSKMHQRLASCFLAILTLVGAQDIYSSTIKIVNKNGVVVQTYGSVFDLQSKQFSSILKGITVLANPPDACKPIDPPPFLLNITALRFVLINSTEPLDCLLDMKIINAEAAQYDLVFIYGNDLWPIIERFKSSSIGIPVLHIGYTVGLEMIENYLYKNGSKDFFYMKVYPPPNDIKYYIMLFAIVIGICLIVMLFFIICLLVKCIQARRQSMRNRLTSGQIRQLPTETFKAGDPYDICAICLERYNEGDKLRVLPCSHAYHKNCIDPWLSESRRTCPLCKRKIRFDGDSSDSGSESEMTSAGEDTPLIGSVQSGSQSWGTFCNNPEHRPASDEIQQAAEACGGSVQHGSELEKSEDVPTAIGSINSSDDVEFHSCNLPQEYSINIDDQQDRLI